VRPLAIIGIDGGTLSVVEPMLAAGELPNLARIFREGASGELESEKPPITPPAWTSFMTGVNPGRHGIFHFIRKVVGTYETQLVDSRNFAGRDLMSLLARRGWTVGAVNVPMTFPPFPLPGSYMISGIPCPLEGSALGQPAGILEEVEAFLGRPYRPDVDYGPYDGDSERPVDDLDLYDDLRRELFEIEEDRLRVLKEWYRRQPTDLLFTCISVTDRISHYFWRFQDPAHPGWSEEGQQRFGGVIAESYRFADRMVGEIREMLGEEATVVLFSDHGFGPQTADFQIADWLEQEGFLVRRRVPRFAWGRTRLGHALERLGLGGLARGLGPLARLPVVRPKIKRIPDMRDIVWERTRAWPVMHGIAINQKGREPKGIVEPGEDTRRLLVEIAERLDHLRFPDGRKAVDYSALSEAVYRGPFVPTAPDLQYQMDGLACLPKEGWSMKSMFETRRYAPISGQHRFEGFFAAAGPTIAPGSRIEDMHIQDCAPTLFHVLGEPVPGWMEGHVHAGILRQPREPEVDDSPEPEVGAGTGADAFSEAEAAAIEESLRGLGYLQ